MYFKDLRERKFTELEAVDHSIQKWTEIRGFAQSGKFPDSFEGVDLSPETCACCQFAGCDDKVNQRCFLCPGFPSPVGEHYGCADYGHSAVGNEYLGWKDYKKMAKACTRLIRKLRKSRDRIVRNMKKRGVK